MFGLKATAFSAACKERSDVDVSAGLVEQPCSATVSRLSGFGMGPDLGLLQSGCGAAETDFNGALSAAETALTGAVCAAETDFHGMLHDRLSTLCIVTFPCLLSWKMTASDDVRPGVCWCVLRVLVLVPPLLLRRHTGTRGSVWSAGFEKDSNGASG